jgi:hypothetical protein
MENKRIHGENKEDTRTKKKTKEKEGGKKEGGINI